MIQRLIINDQLVDIDSNTAIGITLQSFDIQDPGKLKTNISNDVSLPITANNLNIIGLNSVNFWGENTIYETLKVKYYIDNELIVNGQCYTKEVGERIKLVLITKPTVWDVLKTYTWIDFIQDYIEWANITHISYFSIVNELQSNEYIRLMLYRGHLFDTLDNENSITINFSENLKQRSGGYLFISFEKIFQFLTYKLDFPFVYEKTNLENHWIPARSLAIGAKYNSSGVQLSFAVKYRMEDFKEIEANTQDKPNINLYDVIIAHCKAFNYSIVFTFDSVLIRHFNTLKDSTPYDLTKYRATKNAVFSPIVGSYSKTNYIRYAEYFEGATVNDNSIQLLCLNDNIQETGDLYTIEKTYFPKVNNYGSFVLMDLKNQTSFDNITFVQPTASTKVVNVNYSDGIGASHSQFFSLQQADNIDVNDFTFFQEILLKPKVYTAYFYLGMDFFRNFDPLRQYYVRDLFGSYYINRVDGFNPKSKDPVKLELIYASAKLPPAEEVPLWADGVGNPFIDGSVNQSIFY